MQYIGRFLFFLLLTIGTGLVLPFGPSLVYAEEAKEIPVVDGRYVLGYVEPILVGSGIEMEALLSPSTHSSELGVDELTLEKGPKGETLAIFTLRGKQGESEKFALKVLKRAGDTEDKNEKRGVVVKFPICIGSVKITPQFRLTDRSRYEQKVRIGRRVLSGRIVVDPSMTHSSRPSCKDMTRKKPDSEKQDSKKS